VDFFTFIIIAVFIYNIFAKKDKPPQRRQRSPEEARLPQTEAEREPVRPERRKKESIFENLERQIRESAERLEKELQGQPQPQKPAPVKTYKRQTESRPSTVQPSRQEAYADTEGVWGEEGRSDYDKYVSKQGTVGVEGVRGQEGAWGSEGSEYARRQQERAGAIEQAEIGAGPDYGQERYAEALGFSSAEIVQGIIWAEVLKEPKGKRMMARR